MTYKWWVLALVLLALSSFVDARGKRRKSDGDFEFDDEDDTKNSKKTEKKTWILDLDNDLCQALRCRKKEICLLEDPFTAVCVSRRELHRNGDEVLTRQQAEKELPGFTDFGEEEEDDDDDEDIFDESEESVNGCTPCPVVKPTFVCGTDNQTYSSLCRLDYHNCIHGTHVRVNCDNFCPCKELSVSEIREQKKKERKDYFTQKYMKSSKTKSNKYHYTPQEIKYKDKVYKYAKWDKFKPEEVTTPTPYEAPRPRPHPEGNIFYQECSQEALATMGNRLLDWFSVVMADSKKENNKRNKNYRGKHFPGFCKKEVRWMFQHLDLDEDGRLSLKELYDLEHDENERCMKPFLDQCDLDRDVFLNPREWCKCFDKSERPCAAVRKRSYPGLLGAYVPACDPSGYYEQTQCHPAVGMCWCVDRHGVEFANTRTRGRPNCESLIGPSEDDSEYGEDEDVEGSADTPLDF